MSNLTYQPNGEYELPNITLQDAPTLGKYGRLRREHLREQHPILFNSLAVEGKLHSHLLEIDQTASRRLEQLMPLLMRQAGVTEDLKASDPLKWTGLMNNLKAQAEELILAELVYS